MFLKGCPLRCIWCHNPEGIQSEPTFFFDPKICLNCYSCVRSCCLGCITKKEGIIEIQLDCCAHCDACVKACPANALSKNGVCYSSDELMEIVKKDIPFFDESDGGVTFSGGEPLFQFEFLNEMLIKCKSQGIHTVLDTSGLAPLEKIDAIKEHTDLFLYDIKFVNEDEHIQYTGVSNILILKNLRFLISENIPLWIRIPIIP
ncbi:MAG: glycyl-radical enzyme activating protein, partial [Thermotogota bacterium]